MYSLLIRIYYTVFKKRKKICFHMNKIKILAKFVRFHKTIAHLVYLKLHLVDNRQPNHRIISKYSPGK